MKKNASQYITNLEILRYQKFLLEQDIEKQEKKLDVEIRTFKSSLSPDNLIHEIAGTGESAELLADVLPLFLKYRQVFTNLGGLSSAFKGGGKITKIALSGLGIGLLGYLGLRKNKAS